MQFKLQNQVCVCVWCDIRYELRLFIYDDYDLKFILISCMQVHLHMRVKLHMRNSYKLQIMSLVSFHASDTHTLP